MSFSKVKGQKSGNNTLFFIAGFLSVVLLILVFLSKTSESSVDQLIQSAAPDSSAYASQELVNPQTVEKPQEEEAPEKKKVEIIPLADSTVKVVSGEIISSDTVKVSIPVEKPKTEETGEGKIYFYKIKRGDTMYKIAAKFGNKPADVMAQNGLTDMGLQADKEIKVKIKALHQVADGEGLKAISEKYSVSTNSIQVANGLSSDALAAGVQLIIPLK